MNKKIFSLSLMLLSCSPIWAILPESLKGLAEGGLVDDLFSPVHGFLAIETGTLERIRFYGHYGKVYEYDYDNRQVTSDSTRLIDPSMSFHPEWLHPIFKIKDKASLDQEVEKEIDPDKKEGLRKKRTQEIDKNFDRQFEYPLDPISALVQWLFPSVDGANLVVTYGGDRGHPSREIKTELRSTIKKTEFLPKILKAILEWKRELHDISAENRTLEKFISKIDPDSSGDKKTFLEILYYALLQDGTFSTNHSPLYPKHISLHALLGFLWQEAEDKKQIAGVLEASGLLEPESWKDQSYTKKAYKKIRKKIQKRKETSFKEKAYAGYAYTLYDSLYPEKISYGNATAPNGSGYGDCGETMVRNFFNVVFYQKGEEFSTVLKTMPNLNQRIVDFYTKYPNISAQKTPEAREAWVKIVSNLTTPDAGNGRAVQYNNNSQKKGGQSWEIISGNWGIGNVLNVIANLTGDESLGAEWLAPTGSDEFYHQISEKLDRLCEMFSREQFQLAWSRYDNGWEHDYDKGLEIIHGNRFGECKEIRREPNKKFKEISSPVGEFRFVLKTNNTEEMPRIFDFVIKPMHFDFNLHKDLEDDWRKASDMQGSDFLSTYYSKNPSLFLNQSIEDMQSQISEMADSDLWILRMLYKRFAHQIENEFHQSSIASSLYLIKNKESSFFKDFGRTLLVERLKGIRSPYSDLFTCEFTDQPPSSLNTSNNSILIDAVEWGFSEKTIKWLLEKGAPLANYKDLRTSVLHTAISYAPDHIIELLIQDVVRRQKDLLNMFGGGHEYGDGAGTPLHFAASSGSLEIVKLLVENGAKIDLEHEYEKDEGGETPLDMARNKEKSDKSRSEIVAFLTQLRNLKKSNQRN